MNLYTLKTSEIDAAFGAKAVYVCKVAKIEVYKEHDAELYTYNRLIRLRGNRDVRFTRERLKEIFEDDYRMAIRDY